MDIICKKYGFWDKAIVKGVIDGTIIETGMIRTSPRPNVFYVEQDVKRGSDLRDERLVFIKHEYSWMFNMREDDPTDSVFCKLDIDYYIRLLSINKIETQIIIGNNYKIVTIFTKDDIYMGRGGANETLEYVFAKVYLEFKEKYNFQE